MAIDYDRYIHSTGIHYIANSGSDENKSYSGGRAGDQTGHEWELKAWYNRPWTVILRWPDQAVALTIARLSIEAALNDKIGYDQSQRTTYWQQLKAAGFAPSKITTACEEDCTAGVSANVRAAGHLHGIRALQDLPLCSSRNMRAEFTKAGFKALTASKYLTGGGCLLPGDILLYEGHHAAANVTLGASVRDQWRPDAAVQRPDTAPEKPDTAPEEADDGLPMPPYVFITGDAHVRQGPGKEYPSMGVARKAHRLHWWGFTYLNGWQLVEFEGKTGWISPKYAEVEDDD